MRTLFEKFGHVREAKVIRSGEGASKGYGFITFDSEEEAKLVMEVSGGMINAFTLKKKTLVTDIVEK